MKKYTNMILIITAIVLVFGMVFGYTIDFQTKYKNGEIKYEKRNTDSLELVIRDAMNEDKSDTITLDELRKMSQQGEDSQTEKETETSNI